MIFALIIQIAHRHIATTKKEVKIQAKQKKKKKKNIKRKMVVLTFFVFFLFCSTAFFFLNNKTHTPKETFVNSHYTVFKILGTEFINSALLNLEEKKNMVKI